MAIEFNCPHCQHAYRLPDKFAGKAAKCKNPDCRQLITIPAPITIPDDVASMPSAAELEAAALSALADETPKPDEAPTTAKVIPMVCKFCDHKWDVPWSLAGKNTLCPNPECRQRVKVPEPQEDVPTDWRQPKSKLPSMAKQNFEKLEDVQDAGDAKYVGPESLKKADATGVEIEPRTLKEKLTIVFMVAALVGIVGGTIWYFLSRRIAVNEDTLMVDALKEYDKIAGELNPPDAPLCSAVLNLAAAEYALRHDDSKKLKDAHDLFGRARGEVQRQPAGPARNVLAAELSLAVLAFSGTEEQVQEQTRFSWTPDIGGGRVKMSERGYTVHEELRQTLGLLQAQPPIDFDFRISLTRQLTRKLAKLGQAKMAADLIPLALFSDPEKDEARAVIALELYRGEKSSVVARSIAEELKTKIVDELKGKGMRGNPYPASAQTLFVALKLDKAPQLVPPMPPNGGMSDPVRMVNVGKFLLDNQAEEALKVSERPGSPESQLKALVLCVEWMPEPSPALDAAQSLITSVKGRKDVALSPYSIFRLVQLAAEKGKFDHAKALTDALTDEGLKAWAKGEIVRQRIAASPKEKADEGWAEVPDEPKKQKAGHAWAWLNVARQNAKVSHNRDAEKKATATWAPALHPFALAGIALGLQDK
jgi:hypothetical protein